MRQTRALHDLPQKDSVKSGLINPCTVPPQGIPGLPNIVPYFTNSACVRQFMELYVFQPHSHSFAFSFYFFGNPIAGWDAKKWTEKDKKK